MVKSVFIRLLWSLIIITFLLCADAQPADDKQLIRIDIGRDDPFAQIIPEKKHEALRISSPAASEEAEQQKDPELFVESVTLKFLDAKNLKSVVDALSSKHGRISVDGKSNTLIICDTNETLPRIITEIKKADITPRQIMVEVVILDVQLSNDTEIGINWDILSDKNYDTAYRQNFTKLRLGSTIKDDATTGSATAFNTTGTGGDFSVISGTIRNVVHLIQAKRNVEILASPRVMMVSGESATIQAVEELPYQEVTQTSGGGGGSSAITSTQFKNVGVTMKVSTILVDENNILLNVEAEQNVKTSVSNSGVPVVDTRRAQSNLLLKNGQVVILGGLRRQEKTKEVKQVPFIGDIPLLGLLFKSTEIVTKNSELVIFLSPHVYTGEAIAAAEMAKHDEITKRPLLKLPLDDKK
jgi:type IV pilus assembly protein PilQ